MLPQRIIFSRKGFDTTAGGGPSPIVDGRPVSLPIPTSRYPGGRPYGSLTADRAGAATWASRGRVAADALCHLDPDIDADAIATRPSGWRGAFGQAGAAQSHLRNQGVGVGDLFLFFGLFRPAERTDDGWRWTGKASHQLFGWLRIGEVASSAAGHGWLAGHPHASPGWPAGNTIYIAADRLGLPEAESMPGSGVFARGHSLTASGARCSDWMVPPWLERSRMSYRRHDRFWPMPGRMNASGQWQEGVATADEEAGAWAGRVIAEHAA